MSCNRIKNISQNKLSAPMLLLLLVIVSVLLFSVPVAADDSVGESTLPSKYDLRDYGLVTSVKYQGDYGTCWAFAAISAIESNAIKQGYETLSTADFSEFQLAYFMHNRDGVTTGDVLPELSGLAGDDIRFNTEDYKHYLDVGASPLQAAYHLTTGIGVVRESVVPYSWVSPLRVLDPKYAVSENVYIVSHASFVAYDDRDGIKQNIMDHGCGVISYFDDDDCYNENARYNGKSSTCYYQNTVNDDVNHAACIVGWDDAYPKENFKSIPEHDGAWLVKNSWGLQWGDDGYFWLSYDDPSLKEEEVMFYEVRPQSAVDTIYQYDGTGSSLSLDYPSSEVSTMNKFTARDYETITDVSFVTLNKNLEYEASILNEYEEAVSTVSGFVQDCGYYTIPLPLPVNVNPGEIFYVRVTLTSAGVPENLFGVTGLSTPLDAYDDCGWIEMFAVAEPDQSYKSGLFHNEDLGAEFGGNLRIKAFAVDRDPSVIVENTTDLSTPIFTPISTPAPVAGVLLGLFGACLLLRRRH